MANERKYQYQGIFLALLVGLTGLLGIVRVVMANVLVDESVDVARIEQQTENVTDEIARISSQVRAESSLTQVEYRATQLGFSKITTYSYLPVPETVAVDFDYSAK